MLEQLRAVMDAMPFVLWERFAKADNEIHLYGWIHYDNDPNRDFIVVCASENPVKEWRWFTSTTVHFDAIQAVLGDGSEYPCFDPKELF